MTFREALIFKLRKKEYLIGCEITNVTAYWDEDYECYRVEEKKFHKVEDAVDEFIRRTEDAEIGRKDDDFDPPKRRS